MKSMTAKLEEMLKFHSSIKLAFLEALSSYVDEGGIEVAFFISSLGDDAYCSRIFKGTKSEKIDDGVSFASVSIDWSDKPDEFYFSGSFHTHPIYGSPSIEPSSSDLVSLGVMNFMAIGQVLSDGSFGFLLVERGQEEILLDRMLRGEELLELQDYNQNDYILVGGESYPTQDSVNRYLSSMGCEVSYIEFESIYEFIDTIKRY